MAYLTRSSIFAVKKETTSGTLESLTGGSDFIPLRDGFSVSNTLDTVDTDEIINDIGSSKSIVVGETPTSSWPGYVRHSGVEGQAPEYGVMIESCLGAVDSNGTEHDLIAGSTTSILELDAAEGASHPKGSAVLVKDGTNGYSIRNVKSVSTDSLTLNFNLSNAPALGVNTGKHVLYYPAASGHPTYSIYHFQAETGSAYKQAIAGARTTSLGFEFPAKELATMTVEAEGLKYYFDYLEVTSANKYLDITDDIGTYVVTLEEKVYKTPIELASEIATKCTAASAASGADTITCTYSSTTGKFTLTSDGTVFSILFKTGAHGSDNADDSVAGLIGFADVDQTAALTYTGSAISFDSPYTPSLDDQDTIVVKAAELLIGDNDQITCRKASNVSFSISTPKTDVNSICATTGRYETLTNEREVTFSANLILEKYEAEIFDRAINNTTTQMMFNCGQKGSDGNWQAGKCFNIWMESASITATPIQDQDGYQIIALEARGFISSTTKDVYINYI